MLVGTGLVCVPLIIPVGVFVGIGIHHAGRQRDSGHIRLGPGKRLFVVRLGVQLPRHPGIPAVVHLLGQRVFVITLLLEL